MFILFPNNVFPGNVRFYPKGGIIQSGSNIFITGLCYRPGSELVCDFGEAGIVKGYTYGETEAVCSVPFITTTKQVEFSVYPSPVEKLNFAAVFYLGKCLNIHLRGVPCKNRPADFRRKMYIFFSFSV